jgi:hypothetical protein
MERHLQLSPTSILGQYSITQDDGYKAGKGMEFQDHQTGEIHQ